MLTLPFQNVVKADILNAAMTNIAVHDTDQNIVWMNKAYCAAIGRSLQEIQGKKCYSIWGLANPCRNCPVAMAIETGEPSESELTPWNQDHWPVSQGSWMSKAAPLRDADGIIIGAVVTTFEITGTKETLKERDRLVHDKEGRIKELQFLYGVFEIIQNSISLEAILQDVVTLLPAGWHYPDITRGKIIFKDKEYVSEPFQETEWKLSAAIIANGKSLGSIEVYYMEECPHLDEGPFMKEELDLINGLSIILRTTIERELAGEDLENKIIRRTEELNLTQKMLTYAFDYSPIGKALVSLEGRFLRANRMLCRILGYAEEELLTKTFQELTHPDDLQDDLDFVNQLLAGRSSEYEMEKRYLNKQGQIVWAQLNVSLVRDSDRDPLFFVSQIQDISRRKQAERKMKESRERFKMLCNQLNDVVWISSADGSNVIEVNHAFEKIYGLSGDRFVSNPGLWIEMVHPDDLHIAQASQEKLMKKGRAKAEYRIIRPNGQIRWILDRKAFIYNDQDLPAQMGGIGQDITELKNQEKEKEKLEAQLRQSQKMEAVGRLAGGVAHDFNNMLTVIKGYAEILMGEVDQKKSAYGQLKEILTAANRSMDITKKLLAFARKQTIKPMVMQVNKTVKKMLKLLRKLMGENIDLRFWPEEDLWFMKIDPSQIDQILANLCVNARDAIADVGKVTIETKNMVIDETYSADHLGFVPGEYVQLMFSDNGCGMDKELLDNIFEPFFTTKKIGKGTGLGLATVYGIVKQNNGFINVYSEPEKGTTFSLYFPRHTGKTDAVQEKRAIKALHGNGETILVVEDEVSILNLIQIFLEGLGYEVLTADTPGKALRLAEEKSKEICLLITDVVMPEMNGRDLAEKLQSRYPDLKCLFMSGYTANVIAHHGILDKDLNFIQKPVSRNDLAAKVREMLEI